MRLLALSGSLGPASTNTAVLRAAGRFAPEGAEVVLYGGPGSMPLFNPDLDGGSMPALVLELRQEIASAVTALAAAVEIAT